MESHKFDINKILEHFDEGWKLFKRFQWRQLPSHNFFWDKTKIENEFVLSECFPIRQTPAITAFLQMVKWNNSNSMIFISDKIPY